MIELFKDGDTMAIKTDAKDEDEFIDEISRLLSEMIHEGQFMYFEGNFQNIYDFILGNNEAKMEAKDFEETLKEPFANDWEFQFFHWIPQIVDICCKYRGYKNNVKEKKVLISGDFSPNGNSLIATNSKYDPKNNRIDLSNKRPDTFLQFLCNWIEANKWDGTKNHQGSYEADLVRRILLDKEAKKIDNNKNSWTIFLEPTLSPEDSKAFERLWEKYEKLDFD